MTPHAAKKLLGEHGIKYILAQFVDIHGAAKAKAVPVGFQWWKKECHL